MWSKNVCLGTTIIKSKLFKISISCYVFNSSFYQYTEDVGKELPNYSENLFYDYFLKKMYCFQIWRMEWDSWW